MMDPNACLERLLAAMADNDRDEAIDAVSDLHHWIAVHGGFLPKVRMATAGNVNEDSVVFVIG